MNVNIKVRLNIEETKLLKSANYDVVNKEDCVSIAVDLIRKTKMETGYRETVIEEVLINDEQDITSEVIEK